ncbi:hypothetical protein MY5147_008704 [Beauveria neobassiana]
MDKGWNNAFWGEATSYLKYVLENHAHDYVVTRYIAEFINTLSSLTFVAYGVYGLSRFALKSQTSARLISYCGLIGVGICSAGYHMTLKYHTQMLNFAFGYFVWLLDDWLCQLLTNLKHTVGLPLAFLFELHGWWHIFTAIGGYIAVALVDLITSGKIHKDPTSDLAWPVPLATRLMAGALPSPRG